MNVTDAARQARNERSAEYLDELDFETMVLPGWSRFVPNAADDFFDGFFWAVFAGSWVGLQAALILVTR